MIEDWGTFFAAILGATGALLGLLFVGISLNINKIISSKGLQTAAMQPMFLLLSLLIMSIFFLIPKQSCNALGIEIVITGLIFAIITLYNDYAIYKIIAKGSKSKPKRYIFNSIQNTLPYIIIISSGIVLLMCGMVGIYVMVPAIILAYIQISTMSWALVVDISKHTGGRHWYDDANDTTNTNL
jgi:modulator of FtsH protease